MEIPIIYQLYLSIIIFTIGLIGVFLNRKNLIVLLMSIELILLSANINFVAFNRFISSINLFNSQFSHEVINIGTGYGTTIKNIVLMLANKLDSKKKIQFMNDNKNILDISHVANIDYAKKRLNWKPLIQLPEGLDKILSNTD